MSLRTVENGSTMSRPRGRNPQGEGNRLRTELMAAAGRVLAAGVDPESFSLRAVAREAGITAPSVYLQFASKEALLHAVIEEQFTIFQRAIEAGAATGHDPATALLGGCLAYCRFALEQPASYRIIFESPAKGWPRRTGEQPLGTAAFGVLVDAVAACIHAGQAQPGDPFAIATNIWVALHGTVTLRRQMSRFPWPPLVDQVSGILEAFTGIRYRSPAATETQR